MTKDLGKLAIDAHNSQHLWQCVLLQAARDLLTLKTRADGVSGPAASDQHYTKMWIGSRDFREVCQLAGFDPSRVERAFRKRLTEKDAGRKLFPHQGAAAHKVKPLTFHQEFRG